MTREISDPGAPGAAQSSLVCRLRQQAMSLQSAGQLGAAIALYREVLHHAPTHREARRDLAVQLIKAGEFEAASAEIERQFALFPDDHDIWQVHAFNELNRRVRNSVDPAGAGHTYHLLIACMPKSGSTFLTRVLANLPGMRKVSLVLDYGRREQELTVEHLITFNRINYVAQHHIRCSAATIGLCHTFGIRLVVLVRNIFDVMASLRDHLNTMSLDWSMAPVEPEFRTWSEARQYHFIARLMIPWFIAFYVGWYRHDDKLLVRYEEVTRDPALVLGDVAGRFGLGVNAAQLQVAVDKAGKQDTLLNKGVIGRGASVPADVRALVLEQMSFYDGIDFTPLLGS